MPEPAFIDRREVARMIGVSVDSFDRKRRKLLAMGFPERHPVVGRYLKADIEAWIEAQRKIDAGRSVGGAAGINLAAC